jgi:hypothetical protein
MKAPLILLAVVAALPLWANEAATVGSPDGRLVVTLDVQDGQPFYCVAYDGLTAVGPSLLGLKTNEQDLTRDFSIKAVETSRIDEQYSLDRSKKSQVHYVANRLLATLATSRDQQLLVAFRVSDNDVAFR